MKHDNRDCPAGYTWTGFNCEDIDECSFNSPCQYHCSNTPGGYECTCPTGYVVDDGRCEDVDECEDNPCGGGELCFNERGSFQCLESPCPPGFYLQDKACVCDGCDSAPIQLNTISVARGTRARLPLVRLTAYDSQSRVLQRTRFRIVTETPSGESRLFAIRQENGRGLLSSNVPLPANSNYRLLIRAQSVSEHDNTQPHYRTDFIVFVSVSQYPF